MKKLAYLLLLCLFIISVSACGSNDETPASTPEAEDFTMQVKVDAGNGRFIVDWQMKTNAEYYYIYYIADASNTYNSNNLPNSDIMKAGTKIQYASATYTRTGLTNNTRYWIAMTAYNSTDGESHLTSPISVVPTSGMSLTAPVNVRAIAGNANVTVTWSAVNDVDLDHYLLYCYYYDISTGNIDTDQGAFNVDGGLTSQVVSSVHWAVSNTTTTLENDRDYYFWIYAVGSSSNIISSRSFMVSATPSTSPAPSPPLITSIDVGSFNIDSVVYNTKVAWTAPVTGTAASYKIYVGTARGVTQLSGVPSTAGPNAPLEAGANLDVGTYYIVMTAIDASNRESAESTEWWVTVNSGGTTGSSGKIE